VFKIKRNGVFRARLVAQGFTQIPGVDFTESYAPVVNDVTFRLVLVIVMVCKLNRKIIDVETAFLHGILQEEIYMKIPDGYTDEMPGITDDHCLLLKKSIYGIVQAARLFFLQLTKDLKEMGFCDSKVDPCLLYRKDERGICIVLIYVDDNYVCGSQEAIQSVADGLKAAGYGLKIEDANDYLGCEIKFNKAMTRGWLGQPSIIKNLDSKFGETVKDLAFYRTPGTPGFSVQRPEPSDCIPEAEQTRFRSAIGILLYLTKHSRPEIANPVRELSKVMDGATPGQFKEMTRIVKYVLTTKAKGLKLELDVNHKGWYLEGLSDSDFATDKDSRISVTGYVVYFCGVPVAWRSRSQRSVTLSTSESELVACSELIKEIKFIIQVLTSVGIPVKLPVVCHVDNVGAIFLANNLTTGDRTKHIDVRHHFVREIVEEGIVKIIFIKTADNDADLWTKNVTGELFEKHSNKVVWNESSVLETGGVSESVSPQSTSGNGTNSGKSERQKNNGG
jgi:hypothetical protein